MNTIEKKEYVFSDDIGDATITAYEVFPGVQLAYHSVHMDSLDLGIAGEGTTIEIHHCREGRIEQEFDDDYFYLMPGDLSIALRSQTVNSYKFPLRHYHGITIGINTNVVSDGFSRLLEETQVQPLEVAERLCSGKHCFIIRSQDYIEHIFSELYSVPEHIKTGYFKVKILELLLMLRGIDLESNQAPSCTLSRNHVLLANRVAAYLTEHMEQHITIAELAREFSVSESHLKAIFKGVYGVAVSSYGRIQKMQSAAQLLIHTDRPVAEIAREFGYTNAAKFTTAFQKIMGENPSEYRKAHSKLT